MEKIIIRKYDLSLKDGFKSFQKTKHEFLSVLSEAFGSKYFGNKIYSQKINSRNLTIYAAFDKDKLAGILSVKDKQKLSGLAVLEEYRRKSIASSLCKNAQKELPYLYGEVDITNNFIQELLEKLNFKRVKSKAVIVKLLAKQNDSLFFVDTKEYCSYKHINHKYDIDQMKTFIMYEFRRNKVLLGHK